MVLLIDTNVILDVLINRPEFVKDSSMIWKLCETEQARGYISTLTYANMMYVMRKQMTPDQIAEIFRKLSLIFEFADFSPAVLERAVTMKWKDFEDAVRNAISIGGDSDTIGCITGSIAEALYGIPNDIRQKGLSYLPNEFKKVIDEFEDKFGNK